MPHLDTIAAYRAAGERGDATAVADLLAPGVVLHSPLTGRVRFEGRDEVAAMHRDIFAVLDGLTTGAPLAHDDACAFPFRATVRGAELDMMVLVACDAQGRIADLTLFGRPLPAVAALFAALPPRVAARRRGRPMGALVAVLTRPLALALAGIDRVVPRVL